ncbi:hypothetical protein TIFTF001_013277 [Ficus carica]|uniref:Uncharacterized protein n=1 Tax=Ficus carica TaxID=3494 RepID=A0AA88D5W7_FICCA|nr:hypothetical protein TIFTF001_013277 [Ficus carica]
MGEARPWRNRTGIHGDPLHFFDRQISGNHPWKNRGAPWLSTRRSRLLGFLPVLEHNGGLTFVGLVQGGAVNGVAH